MIKKIEYLGHYVKGRYKTRSYKAVEFYRHQGMTILRQGDFDIGEGFYMNDYIMGLTIG